MDGNGGRAANAGLAAGSANAERVFILAVCPCEAAVRVYRAAQLVICIAGLNEMHGSMQSTPAYACFPHNIQRQCSPKLIAALTTSQVAGNFSGDSAAFTTIESAFMELKSYCAELHVFQCNR